MRLQCPNSILHRVIDDVFHLERCDREEDVEQSSENYDSGTLCTLAAAKTSEKKKKKKKQPVACLRGSCGWLTDV